MLVYIFGLPKSEFRIIEMAKSEYIYIAVIFRYLQYSSFCTFEGSTRNTVKT